jgi:hypothetical protein
VWLVGVNGIITGSGHLFMPAPVAESIGWPTSRFQWEVGLADLSYGVAGVMAPSFDRGFWLATIVVFSIFMLGAAVGHVRSMVAERNFAPGNAGFIFWYDLLAPILLIVLPGHRVIASGTGPRDDNGPAWRTWRRHRSGHTMTTP